VICHTCKKKGHFSLWCFTKSIAEITTEVDNSDAIFLNTIDSVENNTWTKCIVINKKEFCFKLDTGAEATVMSENVVKLLGVKELQKPTKKLCGPDQKSPRSSRKLYLNLSYKDKLPLNLFT